MFKKLFGVIALASCVWSQSFEGNWQGTLEAGAVKLRIGLHVSKEGGAWKSTLDSIDQGAANFPVAVTTVSGKTLHFEMPKLSVQYDGTLSADGNQIAGTFTQGAAMPLVFKRVENVEVLRRPQEPKPPFPYETVVVTYKGDGDVALAGTLTIPSGDGPFPAALMITGSGPQNRDEALFGHKPFWVIADYLSRRGIAVLRVDDRGVGESSGNSTKTTIEEMASDVIKGVEFLKTRKKIDAKKIGVIGHSEGGIVGPLAASRSADIAFVVMLAGTGVPGDKVLLVQAELAMRSAGADDTAIERNHAVQEMMFRVLRTEPDPALAAEKMREEWQKMKAGMQEAQAKEIVASDNMMNGQIASVLSPEIRSFIFYDPASALRKLKVPVLALNGSRDIQVSAKQNLPAITASLAEAGNQDFAIVELPGLNHLFQKCSQCTVGEYGTIEETFSPGALDVMGEWLARHTR